MYYKTLSPTINAGFAGECMVDILHQIYTGANSALVIT